MVGAGKDERAGRLRRVADRPHRTPRRASVWGTLDRKAYPNPLYVRTGEVIYSSDDFLAPPPKA